MTFAKKQTLFVFIKTTAAVIIESCIFFRSPPDRRGTNPMYLHISKVRNCSDSLLDNTGNRKRENEPKENTRILSSPKGSKPWTDTTACYKKKKKSTELIGAGRASTYAAFYFTNYTTRDERSPLLRLLIFTSLCARPPPAILFLPNTIILLLNHTL